MTKSQRNKLKKLLGIACRLRDKGRCLRCGKTTPLHTSHIYGVGKAKSMEFELDNVKTLCGGCHIYWWHKNPMEASEWLKTVIPKERLDKLKKMFMPNRGLKKIYNYEEIKKTLEEAIEKYS